MCSSPRTNRKSFNDASAHLFAFSCLNSLKLLTDKKTSKNKVKKKSKSRLDYPHAATTDPTLYCVQIRLLLQG